VFDMLIAVILGILSVLMIILSYIIDYYQMKIEDVSTIIYGIGFVLLFVTGMLVAYR